MSKGPGRIQRFLAVGEGSRAIFSAKEVGTIIPLEIEDWFHNHTKSEKAQAQEC